MLLAIIGIIFIGFLICLSAFFSSSEMAFVSINRALVAEKAQQGDKKAQILEKLLAKPDNVISAIVIGNNIINIFASILAGWIAIHIIGDIGIGIATAIMTLLVIILGEMTPKALGIHNEQLAYRVARPLAAITWFFTPLVIGLTAISNGLLKAVGRKHRRRASVTEDEIMAMMRLGEKEGTIEKDELDMVDEVFEFDETRAYEVYTPKDKVAFIQEDASADELINKSIKTGFSRFPVYRKDIDDIVGMVHVKDTLKLEDTTIPVKQIMRKILKIDSRMKVDDVLREMKRSKTHLALLMTPEGKTRGLVSMEDLIEEIFGEIVDEHDTEAGMPT
jgi:putative hemolysin